MTKIAELYGISTDPASLDQKWAEVIGAQQCPFLGRKCLKNRKSEPALTIGSCTVLAGKRKAPVMVCPFRLLERRQIFEDCKSLATLHEPGNEWHIIPELDMPGGSVNYCLASIRRRKVRDFVGIELQTLDTTGTVWPERQRFAHFHGVRVKNTDRMSSKPFGINWKMTAKTILVQLHHKISTFEHLSKKLVLVVQDQLLAYMRNEFSFAHLVSARVGDSMHFHSYSMDRDESVLRLQLAEQLSTDAIGIAKCLGLQSEARIELEAVVRLIESKLSDRTLLTIENPPAPASLVQDVPADES